jgi:hypothetical protein
MLQNILLLALGFILGSLLAMLVESSLALSYLRKLRKLEFDHSQLSRKFANVSEENYNLSVQLSELKNKLNSSKSED